LAPLSLSFISPLFCSHGFIPNAKHRQPTPPPPSREKTKESPGIMGLGFQMDRRGLALGMTTFGRPGETVISQFLLPTDFLRDNFLLDSGNPSSPFPYY